MFKKILTITALVVVLGVLVFGAVNRTMAMELLGATSANRSSDQSVNSAPAAALQVNETAAAGAGSGNGRGPGAGGQGSGGPTNLPPASGELSAEEAAALTYMREEEKLAHDVYVTLYAQWGLPVFQNISGSEQTHTEAVKTLLDRYGLADPATGGVGVFTNPELQALYNDLTARGSKSLGEALKVGAAIEEIDILDLQARLAQTDNADIQQVFNSLLNGSYNHLRAFVSTLQTQTGESYQPQYLSTEAYQAIIAGAAGSGNGQGGGRGRGRGNR
jgi:hypothetical protein